jgi:phosphoglycerol transferase MdoB-like AlkP superfamily enzyme
MSPSFYAPELLQPEKRSEVVSQIDILPTIAGMLHQSYVNTALGRDLLDPLKKNNYAFITNTAGAIGMVTDDFYFTRNINFPDEQLAPMHAGVKLSKEEEDSVKQRLSVFYQCIF